MDANFNLLAETLARSGLAMSPGEAQRMARSIIGTETMVAKEFNTGYNKIEVDYATPKKRTYQEEIDYLIEKTNFQHRDFHIPIAGYSKERAKKEDSQVFYELDSAPAKKTAAEIQPEKLSVKLPEKVVEKTAEKPRIKLSVQDLPLSAYESPINDNKLNEMPEPVAASVLPQQEAYTDVLDDCRVLLEVMKDESQTDSSQVSDDFIVEVKEEDIAPNLKADELLKADEPAKAEQLVAEEPFVQEVFSKPAERVPIEKIDLMNHFKFG